MPKEYSPAVLIVDDVPENIQIVAGILRNEGYNMAFATSGQAALDICKNNDFDLILLDVMMPEMDGFEVCAALKQSSESSASATVVFLTAKTDVESAVRGFELGGSDYITKPFNASELLVRVKTHMQLRINQRQLRQMNEAKDRFISIIAHELKGPLVGLNGVLRMVDEEFESLEPMMMQEYIALSRKASDQLLGLIDNLFTWSTLQNEELPFAPAMIDLSGVVAECAACIAPAMSEKRITLHNAVEDGCFIFADEEMVRIVITNLLTNALMFTPADGKVQLSCQVGERDLALSIEDSGVGISEVDQQKLFRIEHKFKHKGTAGEMGTGMGLILSQELVQQNGGTLTLRSTPGQGTVVTLSLPRQRSESTTAQVN